MKEAGEQINGDLKATVHVQELHQNRFSHTLEK
jgi:hypothetical protein